MFNLDGWMIKPELSFEDSFNFHYEDAANWSAALKEKVQQFNEAEAYNARRADEMVTAFFNENGYSTASFNRYTLALTAKYGAAYGNSNEWFAVLRYRKAQETAKNAALAANAPDVLKKPRAEWTFQDWRVLVAADLAVEEIIPGEDTAIEGYEYRLKTDKVRGFIRDGIDDLNEEDLAKLGL